MFGKDLGVDGLPCDNTLPPVSAPCGSGSSVTVPGRSKVVIMIPDVGSAIQIGGATSAAAGMAITLIAPGGDTFAGFTLRYLGGTGGRVIRVQ